MCEALESMKLEVSVRMASSNHRAQASADCVFIETLCGSHHQHAGQIVRENLGPLTTCISIAEYTERS
jgi:hypothetical protein